MERWFGLLTFCVLLLTAFYIPCANAQQRKPPAWAGAVPASSNSISHGPADTPNPNFAAELGPVHTAYLQMDTADTAFNLYLAGYIQAWGGYQILPTPQGADLVFRFNGDTAALSNFLVMTVYDGKTMEKLGTFQEGFPVFWTSGHITNIAKGFIADLTKMPGVPQIAQNPKGMMASPPTPIDIHSIQLENLLSSVLYTAGDPSPGPSPLHAAQNVLVVDGYTAHQFPYKDGVAFNLFLADIQASGRYKIVHSLAEADIVIDIGCSQTYHVVSPRGTFPDAPGLNIAMLDPRTFQELWRMEEPVNFNGNHYAMILHPTILKPPSGKADPLPPAIQSLTDTLGLQSN